MKNRQNGSAMMILIIAIVVLFVLIAFALVLSVTSDEKSQETGDASLQEQSEDLDDQNIDESEESDESTEFVFEEINLEPVDDFTGYGVANRELISSEFVHEIYIQTEDPSSGKFYEGWLVGDSIISTGKLEKDDEDVWILKFKSNDNLYSHKKVVITEETDANGLDGKPETHVFEGEF